METAARAAMASFKAPVINDNPDGWGPPMDLAPAKFQDMPYAPFSKSDRLGRAADWTAFGNRPSRDPSDDASSEFIMVDNKALPRPTGFRGRGGFRGGFRGRGGRGGFNDRFDRDRRGGRGGSRGGRGGRGGFRGRWDDRRNMQREASVEVGPEWAQVEEVTSSALSKLTFTAVSAPEDIALCGSLPYYDRSMDRVTVKAPRALKLCAVEFPHVTTTDDPVIRRIAGSGTGTVFATGAILSLIMVAPRAVQSWDIVVQRINGKLFLDKRDGSMVDFVTVNETSHDAPKDEKNLAPEEVVNSFQKLSAEATAINQNFTQMVVSAEAKYQYPEPNPFAESAEGPLAAAAYRYRKWTLGDDIVIVARCDLDAALKPAKEGGAPLPMTIRALNEYFDPNARQSTDWRGKLDTQRGAVLATEVKNNASKLARWTAEALLAETDQVKFGFVSRVKAQDSSRHSVLGTQMFRPKEFASQIALNVNNMWGILKHFIDLCYKHLEDGETAVIMKDPNKPAIRIYKVPDGAFETDEEEEEDDDGEDDE